MTYLGALIVVISALSLGVFKAKEERTKTKTLCELCSMLEMFENEICTNRTPLGKVISARSMKSLVLLRPFLSSMQSGFKDLGDRRFFDIWSESINNTLMLLPEKSKSELIKLGNSLGRYDSDLQRNAIERCMSVLRSECEELESGLKNNEKMYIGLSGGAGLILALMLI